MIPLRKVSGIRLKDDLRDLQWELGAETLLRWFGHLIKISPRRLLSEVRCPTRRRPCGGPRTHWKDYIPHVASGCSGGAGKKDISFLLVCCHRDLVPDTRQKTVELSDFTSGRTGPQVCSTLIARRCHFYTRHMRHASRTAQTEDAKDRSKAYLLYKSVALLTNGTSVPTDHRRLEK